MKQFAVYLAQKAGQYLLANFRKDSPKDRALAKELKSKYDRSSNELIIKEINRVYPKHSILTEESGSIHKKSDYTWVIDPLDGSTIVNDINFLTNIAIYSKNQ